MSSSISEPGAARPAMIGTTVEGENGNTGNGGTGNNNGNGNSGTGGNGQININPTEKTRLPLGDTPWMLMAVLTVTYTGYRHIQREKEKQ